MKSTQARAAAQIRKILKEKFPETKFSVTSDSGSMTSSVNAKWTDGPTEEAVEAEIKQYQYGHFDGMIDAYEHSNMREDIPQVNFVFAHREYSDKIRLSAAQALQEQYWDLKDIKKPETIEDLSDNFMAFQRWYNWYQLTYQILNRLDLTGAVAIVHDENFTSGSLFDGFKPVGEVQ